MSVQHMGIICKDIFPGTGGEMRPIRGNTPQDTKIMIYQKDTPEPSKFKDFKPPKTVEEAMSFSPPYEEAWMNDPAQCMNHQSNRLIVSDLKGNYKILFHEYGQTGWWWISPNLKKIHILTSFLDYTKSGHLPKSAITQLRLFTSYDGGETFHRNEGFERKVGTGYGSGMVFDPSGIVGYVFFDQNIVWQIIDGGLKFRKYYIPHTKLITLPTRDSVDGMNKDAAMVDNHSNLLFSLFQPMEGNKVGSNIYEISETEKETDLSQSKPKYSFLGKRIIALSRIPDKEGFYMFYIECGDNKQCTYYDVTNYSPDELRAKNNAHLHFARVDQDGKIISSHEFNFFQKIKAINVENNGDIGVTTNMEVLPDATMMISHDYGENWHGLDTTAYNGIASDYIDLKRKEYWLHYQPFPSNINQVYKYDFSSIK